MTQSKIIFLIFTTLVITTRIFLEIELKISEIVDVIGVVKPISIGSVKYSSMGGNILHKYIHFECPSSGMPIPHQFGSHEGRGYYYSTKNYSHREVLHFCYVIHSGGFIV